MDVVNPNYLNYMEQIQKNRKDIEKLYDQELSDITQLNFKENDVNGLQYTNGKAIFQGKSTIIRDANTENLEVDSKVELKISSGDDDIVIDAGEDNSTLKIHLDNETKLALAFAESERQKSKNLFDINNCLYHKFSNLGETGTNIITTDSNIRITLNPNNLIKVNPNTQYTLSTNNSNFKYSIGQLTSNKTTLGDTGWQTNSSFTITTSSTTEYLGLNFGKTDDSEISITDYNNFLSSHIQIEQGSVATDYQPYNGAIVHEKEIAPILIYDINEKPTPTGLTSAYTSGIKFADDVNIPIGDFNYFNIYTMTKNNVKKKTTITNKYYYWGDSFFGFNENWALSYFGITFIIENNLLSMAEVGYTAINTNQYVSKNQSEDVVVYRIEGGY